MAFKQQQYPICIVFLTIMDQLTNGSPVPVSPVSVPQFVNVDPPICQEPTETALAPFPVLPGQGWDNLSNKEMWPVIQFNYTRRKVTDDGRYSIPDSVNVQPIRSSYLQTFAELIVDYINSTSTSALSINLKAGGGWKPIFAASGSFSTEMEEIKTKQIENKAVTARVQYRYHKDELQLQPFPKLDPNFEKCLMKILDHILKNETETANYEAELLVKDYGTHYLTRVVVGAGIIKTDYVKRSVLKTSHTHRTELLHQASASFFDIFNAEASYGQKSSTTVQNGYQKKLEYSDIRAHGGAMLDENTSLSEWKKGVQDNLVAMDRDGEPIYSLIRPELLPQLAAHTLEALTEFVRNAVETYYDMNTHRGCSDRSSPMYKPSVNFDDGTCKAHASEFRFGGFFQTCHVTSGRFIYHDSCKHLRQNHLTTRAALCPHGYKEVQLFAGRKTSGAQPYRKCRGCWKFWSGFRCCHTEYVRAKYVYKTYWCVARTNETIDSSFSFGGFYSPYEENPVTETNECPKYFIPSKIFTNHHICTSPISRAKNGVAFAGFFSCQTGNPLAASDDIPFENISISVEDWPKKCPEGYSHHVAAIEQGCAIHYCVVSGALSGPALPMLKRPPFSSAPPALVEENDDLVILTPQDQAETARLVMEENEETNSETSEGNGQNSATGVSCWIALVCLMAVQLVVYWAI